jgi:hypothetical protein
VVNGIKENVFLTSPLSARLVLVADLAAIPQHQRVFVKICHSNVTVSVRMQSCERGKRRDGSIAELLPRQHGRQKPEFGLDFRWIGYRVGDFLAKEFAIPLA